MDKYYAHSSDESKENWQALKEHLENTALLVQNFSESFCEDNFAYNLGLLHDVGKYQKSFQNRLAGSNIKVDHSIAGAMETDFPPFKYCIAGHHAGLPDIGTSADNSDNSTLLRRLKGKTEDYSAFKNEVTLNKLDYSKNITKSTVADNKELAFWIRMMFSCLTDADFLDTEKFYNQNVNRGNYTDLADCLNKINDKIDSFKADTKVKIARDNLRLQVMSHIKEKAEIYFLNMPTGSGKTLTSMQFALNRAVIEKKKHIIYVIPFTSIIEQNAKVFKDIFGENSVLEHHSNFEYDEIKSETAKEKLIKASENWDCSITVTTNVQFFESIYSNKSSDLRKLHNIENSVIVFDEVHMFPSKFFKPCLEAIKILTWKYNCEAIFMSATMPNFDKWLNAFDCKNVKTLDLIKDKSDFSVFERSKIENLGQISFEKLLSHIKGKSLIVVNKKSTAKEIYDKLTCKKFHLSTYMTHYDRDKVIVKIKQALLEKEDFCLISTSLIEAGVDLDFDFVYREIAGLDNLLQTAGRCNREGKKQNSVTYSFEFDEDSYQIKSKELQKKKRFTKDTFELYNNIDDIDAISFYFDSLYSHNKAEMSSMDFQSAIKEESGFNFKTYASQFKFIDDDSYNVIIPRENCLELINQIEYSPRKIKRKLQKYSISLKIYNYNKLVELGVLLEKNGIVYLANDKYYDENTGIKFEDDNNYIY